MVDRDTSIRVIIVTFNSDRHIRACIEHVRRAAARCAEIVVVDNHSSDGTVDVVRMHHPEVRVIELDENVGFARAVNIGAVDATSDWIVLLNPDVRLSTGAIDRLLAHAAERADPVIVGGCATAYGANRLNVSAWMFPSIWSLLTFATGLSFVLPQSRLLNPEAAIAIADGCNRVDSVSGAFMLVDTSTWRRLGGMDEGFALYAEDGDFCFRALGLGVETYVVGAAKYEHDVGSSSASTGVRRILVLKGKATYVRRHLRSYRLALMLMTIGTWLRGPAANAFAVLLRSHRDESWQAAWRHRQLWRVGWRDSERIDDVVRAAEREAASAGIPT